ncbi:DNA polymerase III subunits gamma and tau [Psychrobacter sp. JCM 18901]|nr:DNA polymerase III subunits gamma and tau [Psychrobacter sp. JCM 18901]
MTDQAIAFGQGALDDATVNAMLGLIDAADLVRLTTDIYNHDKSAVAAHIEQMRAQMVDATSMFDGLAELLHQLALTQLLPEVALNVNEAQAKDIYTLAQHISLMYCSYIMRLLYKPVKVSNLQVRRCKRLRCAFCVYWRFVHCQSMKS